ncbi:MAG: hypothetical protein ACLQDQ_12115 [Myxococcaceae bacterium]
MASGLAALSTSRVSPAEDLPRLAAEQLRRLLRQRHDGAVLADFVEEELRTSLESLEAVREHLEDVLRALLAERPAPLDLLEAADDVQAQAALSSLEATLQSLRRRLAQAAQSVAAAPRTA